MRKGHFQIAIDGPVAAGKSTVARMLAAQLSFLYIDTGAMYRAVALYAEQHGISWENESAVSSHLDAIKLRLAKPIGAKNDGRSVSVYLDGKDVSWQIRDSHIAEGASVISQYKKVREHLVTFQQKMSKNQNVVMEGRDIAVRVLPHAQMKIFMTADENTRVERKWNFLVKQGSDMTKLQVRDDLRRRDDREMNRQIDPLRVVPDAWELDTTGMTIEEVVELIYRRVIEMYGK